VTEHGTGIPQTQVDVLMAVYVRHARTFGALQENGKLSWPFDHPLHWDSADQRCLGTLGQLAGLRSRGDKRSLLPFKKFLNCVPGNVHLNHQKLKNTSHTKRPEVHLAHA